MKKKLFSIWSILLVLVVSIALLVPGCGDGAEQGTIEVKATLCDVDWEGNVNYTLSGPGGATVDGAEVPDSFSVDVGSWTCAYVSGGPAEAFLDDIKPSATQELSADGTITFTLNFELDQDAGIEFLWWTVDGKPVEPFEEEYYAEVFPCQIIDVHFIQWVDGCEERVVAVNETSWLEITQVEGPLGVQILVVDDWCALNKTPEPPDKVSQVPSFFGDPVEKGMVFELSPGGEPTLLDVETIWKLVKETDYTKSINWFGISLFEPIPHPCVLFELVVLEPGTYTFILQASASVELMDDVDVNPENNSSGWSDPLILTVFAL